MIIVCSDDRRDIGRYCVMFCSDMYGSNESFPLSGPAGKTTCSIGETEVKLKCAVEVNDTK